MNKMIIIEKTENYKNQVFEICYDEHHYIESTETVTILDEDNTKMDISFQISLYYLGYAHSHILYENLYRLNEDIPYIPLSQELIDKIVKCLKTTYCNCDTFSDFYNDRFL